MILWGWGRRNRSWSLGEGLILMVTWSYFDIFWMPIAFNEKWHILTDNRSEDRVITYEEVKKLIPENTPSIGYFNQYGLLFLIGAFVLLIIIGQF